MLKQNGGGISRPRGGNRQDADHVRGSARDEASGAGAQADDYRAEGECKGDSGECYQHGISQRK